MRIRTARHNALLLATALPALLLTSPAHAADPSDNVLKTAADFILNEVNGPAPGLGDGFKALFRQLF